MARTGGTSGWLRRKSLPSDPEIITRVTVKARWRNSSIFFLLIFILRWLTARGSHLACEKEEKKKRSLNVCVANTRWISFRQAALYERTKVIKDLSSRSSMGSSGGWDSLSGILNETGKSSLVINSELCWNGVSFACFFFFSKELKRVVFLLRVKKWGQQLSSWFSSLVVILSPGFFFWVDGVKTGGEVENG